MEVVTHERAAKMGRELIESFIMWHKQDGKPLPIPRKFVFEDEEALATQ